MKSVVGALLLTLLLAVPVDADPAGGHPDESPPTDGVWLLRAVLDIAESTPKPVFWAGGYLGSSDRHDASHVAASAAAGIETGGLIVLASTVSDRRNVNRVAVTGFAAPHHADADEAAMLQALLAWQQVDWEQRFEAVPQHVTTTIGDKTVLRSVLPISPSGWPYPYPYSAHRPAPSLTDIVRMREGPGSHDYLELTEEAVQYLYAAGDNAISVIALDDETAAAFLELLP